MPDPISPGSRPGIPSIRHPLDARAVRLAQVDTEERVRDSAVHDERAGRGDVDARRIAPQIAAPLPVDVETAQLDARGADAHDAVGAGSDERGPALANQDHGLSR